MKAAFQIALAILLGILFIFLFQRQKEQKVHHEEQEEDLAVAMEEVSEVTRKIDLVERALKADVELRHLKARNDREQEKVRQAEAVAQARRDRRNAILAKRGRLIGETFDSLILGETAYTAAVITEISETTVKLEHASGIAAVTFEVMTPQQREQFGFDPEFPKKEKPAAP